MPIAASELIAEFERLWPLSLAEDWDRPGIVCGGSGQVSKVLLSVDVNLEIIEEARSLEAELILAHHPPLLRGVTSVAEGTLKGDLISEAIRNSIAIYSAHTNADVVEDGVSDRFAKALELESIKPLVEISSGIGHGRVGELKAAIRIRELASRIGKLFRNSKAPIRVAGDPNKLVRRVALVGGAGDSFIADAIKQKADIFITSDLRHHIASDVIADPEAAGMALIDVSHFWAEQLWLKPTATSLASKFPSIEFLVSSLDTDPWTFTVTIGSDEG